MIWLEIRSQDVWLFRDGKPFSSGEDHRAHSLFPPTPMTLQGALRYKVIQALKVSIADYRDNSTQVAQELTRLIGPHQSKSATLETGAFSMAGPLLGLKASSGTTPLIPVPADLLSHKQSDHLIITSPQHRFDNDLGATYLFPETPLGYKQISGYWLNQAAFQAYLDFQLPNPADFCSKTQLYEIEDRVGVSTDAMTSFREEGLLYQVQFIRPNPLLRLIIGIEGIPEEDWLTGNMTLGGEQRLAQSSLLETPPTLLQKPKSITRKFKVIFLTPAYFEAGWQPKKGDADWSALFGKSVKLVSAALYPPQAIGGWNSAANRARPMYHYVAPGSVYYFTTEETISPLPLALTQSPPDTQNAANLGFGQYAITHWD